MSKPKIFIRERRQVDKGEKKPRYSIVATAGTDLQLIARHVRKGEIDQIAESIGAEIIWLKTGKEEADVEVDD